VIAIGDRKEMILLVRDRDRKQHWQLVCFGSKAHYRKDGTCKHTESVLAGMKPWHRSRTTVCPCGGKPA
jgi:hypothetical protein